MRFRPLRSPGAAVPPPPFAHGFSVFGSTPGEYSAFIRACRKTRLKCETFVASESLSRPSRLAKRLRPDYPIVVFQDLPADSPHLTHLTNCLIFPAWFHSIPICFFSSAERSAYPGSNPGSGSIHTHLDAVTAFLIREQMSRILDMSNIRLPFDASPARPPRPDPARWVQRDSDLDPSQALAAAHGRGPMRVLAPAGSGKTRTLVNRVCILVNAGVDPGSILPLAFNRKAAAEMNGRLREKRLQRVEARTFHSLGYEIVRSVSSFDFDAESESQRTVEFLKEAFQSVYPGRPLAESLPLEQSMRLLSAAKMNFLPLDGMSVNVNDEHLPFGPVFLEYLRLTAERGFMNYDDMIYQAVRTLLDNDALRGVYQERYRHILVDEFQDLNRAQILLLQMLAFPENNLFIVGDDDQLIYGWRGASVRSIIEFPRAHPCGSECILSTNYRSPVSIVEHAGWLISRNAERVPKTVNTRPGAPRGRFEICLGAGLWEQARSASEWIMGKKEGHRWGDSAVLFRYNALRFVIALALDVRGIPHSVAEEIHLFESRAGKDVLAWLEVILRPDRVRRDALARILRRPSRVLRRALIEGIETWNDVETLPGSSTITEVEDSAVRRLLSRVALLRQKAPHLCASELIEELDRTICLRSWYTRTGRAGPDPDESDDATYLDVIGAVSRSYAAGTDLLTHVEALHSSPPESPSASESPPGRDEVVLSTIHRAKGKEFDHVVVFDMSRRHRLGRDEIEEERRVAYVALTRAKESLLLTASGRRQSPFVSESALNPEFSGRMREDMESELRGLRGRLRHLPEGKGESPVQTRISLLALIDALEEELRCRSMINMPPP